MRTPLTSLVVLALAALAGMAVAGRSRFDGPVLVTLTRDHGLHLGDVPVLVVALVGLVALAGLHRAGRRAPAGRRAQPASGTEPATPAARESAAR